MSLLEQAVGNKAYFGRFTFKMHKEENGTYRMEVYRNLPKKFEAEFTFDNAEHLAEISSDDTWSLQLYCGNLLGTHFFKEEKEVKNRSGDMITTTVNSREPRIDYFLKCFRYKID